MAPTKGTFSGANVFLSRSLVTPEVFDALHDALRLNGAQVFLCCDPSRNTPNDYHVISSPEHEKFEALKTNGCNLVGPQCILSCAKEHRMLPKNGYTCCLAMDGVKVLSSGFNREEKVKIEKLVTAMGGILQVKRSMDVNFVIVKNVLASNYKWALYTLKKPIMSMGWLCQCWIEHRVVPQEPYKVLPFVGLTICVTGILAVCLDERLFPVPEISSSAKDVTASHKEHALEPNSVTSPVAPPTVIEELEAASSEKIYISDINTVKNEVAEAHRVQLDDNNEAHLIKMEDTAKFEGLVAEDSQEDNDLYLSSCRIFLAGFDQKELRKLVNMIRRGGGTRHTLLIEKLTHIILGSPSEVEKKEVRRLAAWGVINVVKANWLEESDHAKRELPVLSRHLFSELLISKVSHITDDKVPVLMLSEKKDGISESCLKINDVSEVATERDHAGKRPNLNSKKHDRSEFLSVSSKDDPLNTSTTFKTKSFRFSNLFPVHLQEEVIEWVKQGGGIILDEHAKMSTDFIIERHGFPKVLPAKISQSIAVSTHWIRSSLEEGCMQDVASHILYSPLQCHIPLAGFDGLRFCVSQYEGKERKLLRNLCFVLGAKFTETLSKKVTHLLCKFTNGPKYDAACRKGIETVTAEWIAECVSKDKIVTPDAFRPRPATSQDKEAGLCTVSQNPTQAANMISFASQSQREHQGLMKISETVFDGKRSRLTECDRNLVALRRNNLPEAVREGSNTVPDVADAIEDLLAQSDKIFPPLRSFTTQNHGSPRATFDMSSHWLVRSQKQDNTSHSGQERNVGTYDAFSETQTDSQVVGYEEDLSGRQKIIERVRSQSSTLTPDAR
ncbi:hypothetical protein HPP92_001971 [Vanilla planifolia]|uniref:BRCT domain-containing protein n=1 Tax=Vanilla planifolia TaxID=51239 RepID=A0A835S5J2_VANPL|nr:hypothetical protein HPP92_001971 [Vanilla planifolia]